MRRLGGPAATGLGACILPALVHPFAMPVPPCGPGSRCCSFRGQGLPLCSVTAQPGGRPQKGVWEARTGGQARCRRPRTWVRKSRVSPRPRGSRLMKVVHLITCRPPGGDGVDGKGSGPLWDEGSSSFVFHLPQISQTSFRNKKKLVSDLEGKKKVPSGEWSDRLPLIYVHSANVL